MEDFEKEFLNQNLKTCILNMPPPTAAGRKITGISFMKKRLKKDISLPSLRLRNQRACLLCREAVSTE